MINFKCSKNVRNIIRIILLIILIPIVLFILFLGFVTVTDYKPELKTPINIDILSKENANSDEYTIINWNIGYAGLGSKMTFFMDGGKDVFASKPDTQYNIENIKSFIVSEKADFYMFQEVDVKSRRSYNINQYNEIKKILPNYNATFAINYKVPFVPQPILKPYGKVYAGIATYSKYTISDSERYQLPGSYGWPVQLFFLDRCMLLNRIPLKNGKDLVIINTHNSAYDKNGSQKSEQLSFIKSILVSEYKNGNYVVIGGDWNNILPGVDIEEFKTELTVPEFYIPIPETFTPLNWNWAVDKRVPTNRTLDIPYSHGKNYVTVIDGFLCSPNIEIIETETIDTGFKYSDHNPIKVKIRLK